MYIVFAAPGDVDLTPAALQHGHTTVKSGIVFLTTSKKDVAQLSQV